MPSLFRLSSPRIASLAALVFIVAIESPSRVAAAVTLVQDGKPRATIVVSKAALTADADPKVEQFTDKQSAASKIASAARELQQYVRKISGAQLPIVGDDTPLNGPAILVGKSKRTQSFDKKIPSGLTPRREEEGFLILCAGDRLVLAGNDEGPYHGSEYAVAELLGRFGVRWFMPGDFGEVVPTQATLAVADVEVRRTPAFKMRNWWGHMPATNRQPDARWKIRNKMNPTVNFIALPGDSSTRGLIAPKLVETQPELFALNAEGKRDTALPNLTNPKAVALAAQTIKERFRKNPSLTSTGFAPDDGLPRDYNPETVKRNLGFPDLVGRLGVPRELSVSEEWLSFVNAVAREVGKEFPNHLLTTNGYANRNTPPLGVKLEPNVGIMFAAIWSDTLHAYDDPRSWQTYRQGQMIKRWAELSRNVFLYDYTYIMLASAGTPIPLARKHRRDMPLLKKWGAIGFSDEGRTVLMESGIYPRYLRAQMMWDANLDADAVLTDFFTNWYGPAAKPARAFWDALENAMESTPLLGHEDRILPYVYTSELMAELGKQLARAEKWADREPYRQRVKVDRLILEHLKGYLAMTAAEWACDFAEAVKQADTMLEQRKQLAAISLFFCTPDDTGNKLESGFYYWGLVARKAYYQKLADRLSGKTGTRIAILPEKTSFALDPRDEGRFSDWYSPDFEDGKWTKILTTKPFYAQGHMDERGYPYMGAMWYRFVIDVPASAKGQKVHLYAPAVETEAWGWVNGRFVGHRPYHEAYERPTSDMDFDVSQAIEPGKKNSIVLRVHTGTSASQAASGMISRAFLYAAKP